MTDDEFLGATPLPGAMPGGGITIGSGQSLTDDQFFNPQAGTPPPSWGQWAGNIATQLPHRAGVFATGAEDVLTGTAMMPADAARWLANKVYGTATGAGAAPAGVSEAIGAGPSQPPLFPTAPSEAVRNVQTALGLRAEPQDELDRLLYGGGAAVGSLVPGAAVGRGLQALGAVPRFAAALQEPITSLGGFARALTPTIGAGVGGQGAQDIAAQATDNPYLIGGAGVLGGLAGGLGAGWVAPGLGRQGINVVRPFMPSGPERLAGTMIAETAPDIASQNNRQVLDDLMTIGQPGGRTPEEISTANADHLERVQGQDRRTEGAAWTRVDRNSPVDLDALQATYDGYKSGLTQARQARLPSDYEDMLAQLKTRYGSTVPLGEVQDMRSDLLGSIRQARNLKDDKTVKALTDLDSALFPNMPSATGQAVKMPPGLSPQAATDYQAALDASRDFAETWRKGPIGNIFAVDKTGADRVPDSGMLDTMLKGGTGQTERVNSYLNATAGHDGQSLPAPGPLPPAGTPTPPNVTVTPQQNARDWTIAKIIKDATYGADEQGNPLISGTKLTNWKKNNQPLLNSNLFTDDQRAAFDRAIDYANQAQQLRAAGVPPPVPPLKRFDQDYVSGLRLPPLLPAAAGASAGAALAPVAGALGMEPTSLLLGMGMGGALGGGVTGHALSDIVMRQLYGGPITRVSDLLRGAAIDPVEQARLAAMALPKPTPLFAPALARSGTAVAGQPLAQLPPRRSYLQPAGPGF